jgi:hypothetical protein
MVPGVWMGSGVGQAPALPESVAGEASVDVSSSLSQSSLGAVVEEVQEVGGVGLGMGVCLHAGPGFVGHSVPGQFFVSPKNSQV